jgi:hypothetical protein
VADALTYACGRGYLDRLARRYREITDQDSGLTFRFLHDLSDPSRLHVEARWGVSPEQAIDAFFEGTERTVWLERKRCFETIGSTHVVVWLWLDEARSHVLVITCVPRARSHIPG